MKFLLAVLSFFSCLASAAEQFSNIDGKTYYQVLGVAKDADVPTIKTAYRKLMKEAHPDAPGGSTEKAQKINRAYEVVGDETQEKRKKYDEWLSWQAGGESRRRYQEGGEQHYQERSEAIIREEVIRKMIDEILRQSIAVRKARSDLRLEQLAVNARQILVYYQRFLPGSHWRNEDLFNLFKSHALQPLIYEGWPQEALLAFGGGILLYMQERVHDRGYGSEAKWYFDKARQEMATILRNRTSIWMANHVDTLWTLIEGRSFYQQRQPAQPAQSRSNSCQGSLGGTTLKFTDAQGRTWEIPITIEIKIGN